MKVYLAARYGRRHELREYTAQGNSVGVENTGVWCYTDHDRAGATEADRARWAQECVDAVHRAQALVLFTDDAPGSAPPGGGREVEFGVALAMRKKLVIVGPRRNTLHYYGAVRRFDTWAEALEHLRPKSEYRQEGFFESVQPEAGA